MNLFYSKIKENRRNILEATVVVSGILIFALFIHSSKFFRILAFFSLILTAFTISYFSRSRGLWTIFGMVPFGRRALFCLFPGIILGAGLGILTRLKYDLTAFPSEVSSIALLASLIGLTEELIFRGFIQGHVRPAGAFISIVFTAASHTIYKFLIVITLTSPLIFQPGFLAVWTFIGGILFGSLREFSGNTAPPALAHATFDIILYGAFLSVPVWVWG